MATIIVIDDCPETLEQVVSVLRQEAHQALGASTGHEALALARDIRPDLIVGKLLTPMSDGRRLAQAIRSDQDLRHTPLQLRGGRAWEDEELALAQKLRLSAVLPAPTHSPELAWSDLQLKAQLKLHNLARQVEVVEEEERRRIGRELHDEIGQLLTAMSINLKLLKSSIRTVAMQDIWAETLTLAGQALEHVRNVSRDLRPGMLEAMGLASAVRSYVERFAKRVGLIGDTSIDLWPDGALSAEMEVACFRIVQESLTNIVRHAHARSVSVDVRCREGQLLIAISDDGIGFDVAMAHRRADSFGLLGLEERVALLGGHASIESSPHGTKIHASIPIDSPRDSIPGDHQCIAQYDSHPRGTG